MTWGNPDFGSDSSAVQEQLQKVEKIQATKYAFAAIVEDGSVVTWGHPEYGGDSAWGPGVGSCFVFSRVGVPVEVP